MENYILKSNEQIALDVEKTCAYVNTMYFLTMSFRSNKLKKLLNNFENFKETFPDITTDEWGFYSDMNELPVLLELHNYNGWLVEIVVPVRDRFKTDNEKFKVKRSKYIYCSHFNEIVPKMLEFSKSVLEEDIDKFNRDKNENK